MKDRHGNIIVDKYGCPKAPEQPIMNVHTDRSQGNMSSHVTTFITAKDQLTVANAVVNVLQAWVQFTTNACPEEWCDATRTFICETTVFEDGNFNGEITTAADDEAFATIEEDLGMGCPTVEVVGLVVLNEPPPPSPSTTLGIK